MKNKLRLFKTSRNPVGKQRPCWTNSFPSFNSFKLRKWMRTARPQFIKTKEQTLNIHTSCAGLSWNEPILFTMTSNQLIFDFSWSTSGPLSHLRLESEWSCSSGSKQRVFTLHLRSWLFIYGLHCESFNWNFPPKELSTCERKTEIMRVVSGYGLRVMCNFSDWEAKGEA